MQKIQGLSLAQDFTITLLIVIFISQEVMLLELFFLRKITLHCLPNQICCQATGLEMSQGRQVFSPLWSFQSCLLNFQQQATGTVSKVLFTTILFHTGAISILVESFISTMTVIQIHSYIIVEFWFKVLKIICKNEPIY